MESTVTVRVPGTTANCGPGFDTVGIACTIYNDLTLTLSEKPGFTLAVTGEGADGIPNNERNIAYQAVSAVLNKVGVTSPGITIAMHNNIPLARGLGSSAAAIVGGLVAANAATGGKLGKDELLVLATALEGHPDNVAPAIFGGITVSFTAGGTPETLRFNPPDPLRLVVAVPDFGLSTKAARQVLPKTVPYADAVFNVSRAALLVGALCQGRLDLLRFALEDRLHQPYRAKLIPGMDEVLAAAQANGALGAAISGAGPCLIAFAHRETSAAIGGAMVAAFARHGVKAASLDLDVDNHGAKII
ncbi:homoserine kinase [Anaeroselena agilis]|uniref:Homoserine kinase n=1 Tax=Anaeroselena agilis TaxID=3063788 RepID=A0ABU3NXS1_9FIRM|nr:homoserine kinase [Selenomonadales bacterium 4137-cl]